MIDIKARTGGKTKFDTGLNLAGLVKFYKNSDNPVIQVELKLDAMLKKSSSQAG